MSAAARAEINRLNAQSSTGPKTEEGKSRSSLNALGHGLTSKSIVLPHESVDEYNQMKKGLVESYRPANETEHLLVDRLAQAYWRMKRCYGVERAFLENRIAAAQENDTDIDPEAAMAKLFVDKVESARVRLVMRYLSAAERTYYKAMADLDKAQVARRRQEREDARNEAFEAMYAATPVENSENHDQSPVRGFVSYPGPEIARGAAMGAGIDLPMTGAQPRSSAGLSA